MLYTAYIVTRKIVRDIILIVVVSSLIISYYTFRTNAYPKTATGERTPETLKFTYENVNFNSTDNVALKGWFIPAKKKEENKNPATVIVLHGYSLTKADALDWCHYLHDQYNLLLFDFRGHGGSQIKPVTFGYKESKDIVGAIEYLKNRSDVDRTRIGVFGYDIGANAAILAAAETADIRVIIADSAFDKFSTRLVTMYDRYSFLKRPLAWMTGQWFRFLAQTNPGKFSPADSIRYTTAPALFMAAEENGDGSAQSARNIFQNTVSKGAELWTVSGIYDNLFMGQREEFKKRVSQFLKDHL